MASHRTWILALVMTSLVMAACNGDKKPPVDSTAVLNTPPAVLPAPVLNVGWDTTEAGPIMLLSGSDTVINAAVVLPFLTDSTLARTSIFSLDSLSNIPVELFGPVGLVGSAVMHTRSQKLNTEGCVSWPVATLSPTPKNWRAGFRTGIARGIPLDSLEGMTPADSSHVTVEMARIASAVTEGNDSTFRGLPFAVRRAYRFSLGTTSVLIGDVVRKINEEANPREEHLLLVAERIGRGDGSYMLAFQSRVAGSEDVVRTNDVLGAVRFTHGKPAIIVTFEYENGGKVALLERTEERVWKITWRSAFTGC